MKALAIILGLLGGLLGPSAFAQSSLIGFVKTVQTEATVVVDGTAVRAQPGMPLRTGFVVKTGSSGSLGITLQDNTLMSFGPNTEFVVDEYLYAPGKGELKLWATLTKGTLQYVSGIIAKLKPEAVQVKTPAGIIGVRGTRFLARVDDDGVKVAEATESTEVRP
jgi:hypothetical protein